MKKAPEIDFTNSSLEVYDNPVGFVIQIECAAQKVPSI